MNGYAPSVKRYLHNINVQGKLGLSEIRDKVKNIDRHRESALYIYILYSGGRSTLSAWRRGVHSSRYVDKTLLKQNIKELDTFMHLSDIGLA